MLQVSKVIASPMRATGGRIPGNRGPCSAPRRVEGAQKHVVMPSFDASHADNPMDMSPRYLVNEYAPDPAVKFDRAVAEQYVLYAHRLAARGYVQSTLGGMVVRVPHADYPDGL